MTTTTSILKSFLWTSALFHRHQTAHTLREEMKESSSKVFEQNAPTLFSSPAKGKYSALIKETGMESGLCEFTPFPRGIFSFTLKKFI
jgi:hypothetical protein